MKYTLGVLDEESEQITLIKDCFKNDFNIVEIPFVKSIEELIDIIKSKKIDIISIDYKLKDHQSGIEFNGDYFFKELFERFGDFPAFILTQDVESAKKESKKINPRFIVDKQEIHSFIDPANNEGKRKFIDELVIEIQVHQGKIEDDIKELRALETFFEKNGKLEESKENRYIELNNKLSKSISGYSALPQKFFSQETNQRLDSLIRRTEELLKKL